MPLPKGHKIGSYEIVDLIGAGGMGEVYRARDSRLKRDVALKVLPESVQRETEQMSRVQREAELLASLNHPNIATLHGLEENTLVMELVEGDTLRCPLPVPEALRLALQIAEALEYAHERGIIHRDLKPGNIKVTRDGTLKLLDFGLAKAAEESQGGRPGDESPTVTLRDTQSGTIVGTPSYMSPEQAVGDRIDRRSDIFSFGAVLYEMLVGERGFAGISFGETLSAVVRQELDLSKLPAGTPETVRRLIGRCLMKDRRQRLQAIGEARIVLSEAVANSTSRMTPLDPATIHQSVAPRSMWMVAAGAAALLALTAVLAPLFRPERPAAPTVRFQFSAEGTFNSIFYLSPDGMRVAYTAAGPDGRTHVWVRALDALEPQRLPGTEGASAVIWSPDSRFIAFSDGARLRKTEAAGGPTVDICELRSSRDLNTGRPGIIPGPRGGWWGSQGVIVIGNNNVLYQVAAAGGTATPITVLDPTRQELYHARPRFLPDGRRFLYLRASNVRENSGIYVGSLDSRPEEQPVTRLMESAIGVDFYRAGDSASGYLLFLRGETLLAQAFDLGRAAFTGEAVAVAERVGDNGIATGYFTTSDTGTLVYRGRAALNSRLTIFDRQGNPVGTVGDAGIFSTIALSPDGKRLAAEQIQRQESDLWLFDLPEGGRTRLTSEDGSDTSPVWSPDGARLAFASNRGRRNTVYLLAASGVGTAQVLFESPDPMTPTGWSGRSDVLVGHRAVGEGHLWLLRMNRDAQVPPPPLGSRPNQTSPRLSPDGRWIAYRSNESGRFEIYVRPFDPSNAVLAGSEWMVSTGGGDSARWRADGKELFYLALDGTLTSVDVLPSTGGAFRIGSPKSLFRVSSSAPSWDVMPDGERFVMPVPLGGSNAAPFTVVLNWPAEIFR